jgi:DNA-binding Lrp family transcriptional regulator
MVHAYVMVITATGSTQEVCSQIRELDGVVEAHVVAGAYDIIIEMEHDNVTKLLDTVSAELGSIQGVGTTRTYIALA